MTEKQSRYEQIGTDYDSPATVRTEIVTDAAQFTATMWAKHKADLPFDRVFWTNGKHVQVIVREVAGEHEGKAAG